jgi:signal transduction histidine kinase
LIGNAIKFTFQGGISIDLSFNRVTQSIITSVKDTGVGIKEEDIEKLFKFFGQATSSKNINRSGMGLGLTISKMIVQQMGGTIDVESVVGEGSNFHFTFPLLELPENSGIPDNPGIHSLTITPP